MSSKELSDKNPKKNNMIKNDRNFYNQKTNMRSYYKNNNIQFNGLTINTTYASDYNKTRYETEITSQFKLTVNAQSKQRVSISSDDYQLERPSTARASRYNSKGVNRNSNKHIRGRSSDNKSGNWFYNLLEYIPNLCMNDTNIEDDDFDMTPERKRQVTSQVSCEDVFEGPFKYNLEANTKVFENVKIHHSKMLAGQTGDVDACDELNLSLISPLRQTSIMDNKKNTPSQTNSKLDEKQSKKKVLSKEEISDLFKSVRSMFAIDISSRRRKDSEMNESQINDKSAGIARRISRKLTSSMLPWSIEIACCSNVPEDLTKVIKERYEFFLFRSDLNNVESGVWEQESDFEDRISVHTKDIEDNQNFRSEILCPFNIETVKSYVNNQKQRQKNRGRIKSFEFVNKISDQVKVEGVHIKGIWPLSDRYCSNYWCEFYDNDSNYVQLCFDTPTDEYFKKGGVRIKIFITAWKQIPEGKNATRIIHYQEGEAGLGSCPGWITKKAMKDSMALPLKITQILEAGQALE